MSALLAREINKHSSAKYCSPLATITIIGRMLLICITAAEWGESLISNGSHSSSGLIVITAPIPKYTRCVGVRGVDYCYY